MKVATKILFVFTLLLGVGYLSFADRGGIVKKGSTQFNIRIQNSLKNSVRYNLKNGLRYTGSEIVNVKRVGQSVIIESVASYKKGNTTYLVPQKQKIATSQYSPKDGYKLVLRKKN